MCSRFYGVAGANVQFDIYIFFVLGKIGERHVMCIMMDQRLSLKLLIHLYAIKPVNQVHSTELFHSLPYSFSSSC